jgi:hypothetical protein
MNYIDSFTETISNFHLSGTQTLDSWGQSVAAWEKEWIPVPDLIIGLAIVILTNDWLNALLEGESKEPLPWEDKALVAITSAAITYAIMKVIQAAAAFFIVPTAVIALPVIFGLLYFDDEVQKTGAPMQNALALQQLRAPPQVWSRPPPPVIKGMSLTQLGEFFHTNESLEVPGSGRFCITGLNFANPKFLAELGILSELNIRHPATMDLITDPNDPAILEALAAMGRADEIAQRLNDTAREGLRTRCLFGLFQLACVPNGKKFICDFEKFATLLDKGLLRINCWPDAIVIDCAVGVTFRGAVPSTAVGNVNGAQLSSAAETPCNFTDSYITSALQFLKGILC